MNTKQANELRQLAKARLKSTKDQSLYEADMAAIEQVLALTAYRPPLNIKRGVDKVRMIIPREGEFTIREIRSRFRERFPDDSTTDVVIAAYVSRLKALGEIVPVREAHGKQAAVYVVGAADSPEAAAKTSVLDFVVEALRAHGPMTIGELADSATTAGVCRSASAANARGNISRVLKKRHSGRFRFEGGKWSLDIKPN